MIYQFKEPTQINLKLFFNQKKTQIATQVQLAKVRVRVSQLQKLTLINCQKRPFYDLKYRSYLFNQILLIIIIEFLRNQTTHLIKKYMNQKKIAKFSREINSQSQSYQLQAHQMKKFGFQMNKKKITQGSWSVLQNKIYLQFLKDNLNDFSTEFQRRKSRVFYKISKLLKRRTPDQCRSHHQKLLNKHKGSLSQVIRELIQKTDEDKNAIYKGKQGFKFKMTAVCTIDFVNQCKIKEYSTYLMESEHYEHYSVQFKGEFIQLNINLNHIKQW